MDERWLLVMSLTNLEEIAGSIELHMSVEEHLLKADWTPSTSFRTLIHYPVRELSDSNVDIFTQTSASNKHLGSQQPLPNRYMAGACGRFELSIRVFLFQFLTLAVCLFDLQSLGSQINRSNTKSKFFGGILKCHLLSYHTIICI